MPVDAPAPVEGPATPTPAARRRPPASAAQDDDGDDEGSSDDDAAATGGSRRPRQSRGANPGGSPAVVVISSASAPRWGRKPHPWSLLNPPVPIRHYPAPSEGASVRMSLVLDRRPTEPPRLPALNKWQHRQCAECGAPQTTGLGLLSSEAHAVYCNYTELLFCGSCMSPTPRSIPWRILHKLEDTPMPVSRVAATFLAAIGDAPIVSLQTTAPRTLERSPALRRLLHLRSRVDAMLEKIVALAAEQPGDAAAVLADAPQTPAAAPLRAQRSLPSQALSPLLAEAAKGSAAAAAVAAEVSALLETSLGPSLRFLAESTDLLPLSLIVPLGGSATPKGDGQVALARLSTTITALDRFARQRGLLAADASLAPGGSGESSSDGDGADAAVAVVPPSPAGKGAKASPTKGAQKGSAVKGRSPTAGNASIG